nr:unnamed protein product [Spirometra erinaceieuropaei]
MTKIRSTIRSEVDEARLQANLDHLEQWSKDWLLPFNVNKRNFLRVGETSSPTRTVYRLTGKPPQVVDAQKDLGVWITTSLKPSLQCSFVAKSAMSILYLVKRAFSSFDEDCFAKKKKYGIFDKGSPSVVAPPGLPPFIISSRKHTASIIHHIFGRQTLILTRRWDKFAQREATTFEQLSFLHRCRNHGILPKSLRFKPILHNEAGRSLARKYGFRVLSVIISDVHHRLQRFEAIISDLKNRCVSALPEDIFENLQQRINATAKHARMKKRADLQEKLQALLRPINDSNISVRVVSLSKRILTPAESSLLSKGIRFSHVDAAPTNFLANLESLLLTSSIPEDMRADIRNCATGLIRKRRHQQTLPMEEEKRLRSLRSDDSIVVPSADKGGATVIMDKTDYVNKANQAFNDRETYTPIAEDPTKKQAASIKKKVNELTRKKLINPADTKFLTPNDTRIARAYGLP